MVWKENSDQEVSETFTPSARNILTLAREEAEHYQHNYIGTEHLLLGLLHQDESGAVRVLQRMNIELSKVRSKVDFIIKKSNRAISGEIDLTPRAKKAISFAIDASQRLNHAYVDTEDILLGLLQEGEGIAAGVLDSMGVRLEMVREVVAEVLKENGEER